MLTIRVMTIEDYDGVYTLWENTPEMGINSTDDSREGIAQYLRRNPTTSFVAEENGEIVGAILSGHDGRRGFIQHLTVSTACRHQGIGAKLVDATMQALDQEGIVKVALLTFKKNLNANAFWEKMGFALREDVNYRNKSIHALVYRDNPFTSRES